MKLRKTEKIYKLGDTDINIMRCKCGWQFLSITGTEKKCPQCRSEIKHCLKCGDIFKSVYLYCEKCKDKKDIYCSVCGNEKESYKKDFCNACSEVEKVIKRRNMSKRTKNIKTFKESQDKCPHNYDCANCPEIDCILPVDDEQSELF